MVLRFKLAMWKVGGTKIERTRARYIFLPSGHVNLQRSDFGVKRSAPKKFQRVDFLGLVPTESLPTQVSENIVGSGDRASSSKL